MRVLKASTKRKMRMRRTVFTMRVRRTIRKALSPERPMKDSKLASPSASAYHVSTKASHQLLITMKTSSTAQAQSGPQKSRGP